MTPHLCEEGYYCITGTGTNASNSILNDLRTPQPCKKGFYCGIGSCSSLGYGPCGPGEYCPTGSVTPQITQKGYYQEFYGQFEQWLCLPGTFANETNLDVCDPCPFGFECTDDGVIEPDLYFDDK